MKDLDALTELLSRATNKKELKQVLSDLLTDSEITDLVARWETVRLLLGGTTHRDVQKSLGISISKVTHAANLLKKNPQGFLLLFQRER